LKGICGVEKNLTDLSSIYIEETFEKPGDFHHPQKDDGLFCSDWWLPARRACALEGTEKKPIVFRSRGVMQRSLI